MSEKRKIDDADLKEIAGAGEPVPGKGEAPTRPEPPSGGGSIPIEDQDQDGGEQNFNK